MSHFSAFIFLTPAQDFDVAESKDSWRDCFINCCCLNEFDKVAPRGNLEPPVEYTQKIRASRERSQWRASQLAHFPGT